MIKNGVIICDLDGTLIDSRKDLATGVNLMRKEYSLPPLDLATITDFVGNGARKLAERALEGEGVDIDEALLLMKKHYGEHMFDETIVYPTVEEGLLLLKEKEYKLAVVTNKPQEPSEKILNHLGIAKHFDIILGASSRYKLKSDPAMLYGAIDETNSDINKSWMVGDNYTDLESGRRAGVKLCFAEYGFGYQLEESYDVAVESFLEFAKMIDSESSRV